MTTHRIFALIMAATALGISFATAGTVSPPSAGQLREWPTEGCVRSAKSAGVDYRGALERAIRREPAGLAELFRVTPQGFDGAAGEAHAAILFGLLQRWGDKPFAHVLRAQTLPIRKAVIDTIAMPPGSWRKFPLTYASAPH